MTRTDIESSVLEALRRTFERTFQNQPLPDLTGKTKPIRDLGLDSPSGVGFLLDLEDVGIKLGDDLNPFVDDVKLSARSIDEIIIFIESQIKSDEGTA